MKTITKWYLYYGTDNNLIIEAKEFNAYIPLNRYLDKVGWYHLHGKTIEGNTVLIAVKTHVTKGNMRHMLVMKATSDSPGLTDMTEEDRGHMESLAKVFLKQNHHHVA